MDSSSYQTRSERTRVPEGIDLSAAVGDTACADDWASLHGIDPCQVRATAKPGEIQIFALPCGESTGALIDTLFRLKDLTPPGWNWLLNLEATETADLRVMDSLLSIGRHLRADGGALTIKGLRFSANLAPFPELFKSKCRERSIDLVMCSDACDDSTLAGACCAERKNAVQCDARTRA